MRWQRKSNNIDDFPNDIEIEINKNGIKNAVCILQGEDGEIKVIAAKEEDVFQIAGLIDLGRTIMHNNVLYEED